MTKTPVTAVIKPVTAPTSGERMGTHFFGAYRRQAAIPVIA